MEELPKEIRKARAATIALGIMAILWGLVAGGLGLSGGDGITPAGDWLFQSGWALIVGGVQFCFGRQIGANQQTSLRSSKVLSYLMVALLLLGMMSLIAEDYRAIISMLIALLLLSYYRAAKKSLLANAARQTV